MTIFRLKVINKSSPEPVSKKQCAFLIAGRVICFGKKKQPHYLHSVIAELFGEEYNKNLKTS